MHKGDNDDDDDDNNNNTQIPRTLQTFLKMSFLRTQACTNP